MTAITQRFAALRSRGRVPYQGHFVGYRADLDAGETRVVDDLDFAAIKSLLDAADDGDAEAMIELSETMEARDLRLKRVASTRRGALTLMDWTVDPLEATSGDATTEMAKEAADFIGGVCSTVPTFDRCLRGMSQAIGPNLGVVEVIWDGPNVVEFDRIKPTRLTIERQTSEDVRIITQSAPDGDIPPPCKFVIHVPDDTGSFIFTNTIARAVAPIWCIKKLAQADWVTFCEVFGMPVRIAQYSSQATGDEKAETLKALKAMGSKAYALLSDSIKYELKDVARGANSDPFNAILEYCNREEAIGYLGQNLTTDTTGSGGLGGAGAAQIHENVRRAITEEDAKAEEETLRRTLFPWMLRFRFPDRWQSMPIPRFRRIFRDATPLVDKAEVMRKGSQELGLRIPKKWAFRELNIPEAQEGEDVIERLEPALPAAPGAGFSENVR